MFYKKNNFDCSRKKFPIEFYNSWNSRWPNNFGVFVMGL